MRADLADEMARRLVWPQVASHGEDRLQVTFGGLLDLRFVSRNRAKVPRKVRPVLDVGQDIQEVACRRSEEHTSELQSLMRISYAVFCLKKKNKTICDR